jgi:two-component system phosphate regulon response regulator OmpR
MPSDAGQPILLVEDDPSLSGMLERYFTARGYVVQIAESAEQADEALSAGFRPAVVILDVNLPGQTGWSLLRGTGLAAAGSPPVIVATATSVSPRQLKELGAAGYLPKPFPLETLRTTVERLLAGRNAES